MATRTVTRYWSEEQIAELKAVVERMVEDWDERAGRNQFVPEEIRRSGATRCAMLRSAVAIAAEVTD